MIIIYDNYCQNCTQFTKIIKKLDWLHFIEIKKLRASDDLKKLSNLNYNLALKQMASFRGSWAYGYTTLFRMFLRIPVFWLFIPFFWFLKISGIGQYLYLQLAVNRQIIPLHCTEESCELK